MTTSVGTSKTAIAVIALLALAGTAGAGTVGFEGLAVPNSYRVDQHPTPTDSEGFRFTTGHRQYIGDEAYIDWLNSPAAGLPGIEFADNGTDIMWANSNQVLTMVSVAGGAFGLAGFDATEHSNEYDGGTLITVTGHLAGGGTVTQTLTTLARTKLTTRPVFQTFTLTDPGFRNVTKVELSFPAYPSPGRWMSYDNFNIVPLPAAGWAGLALLAGLGAAGRIRRRRRPAA